MRKFFRKKGTNAPSAGEAGLHFNDEEPAEKECEVLRCETRNFEESYVSASGNIKSFSLRFDNPDFSERDSNIFSLNSTQNSVICTSRSVSDSMRQRIETGSDDILDHNNKLLITEVSTSKSISPGSQKSEKRAKSHDSLDRRSDNLLLKKTEEISDFNFKKFNENNMIKENSSQCEVERLEITNEKRASTDVFDNEIRLFSEIDLVQSQAGVCNAFEKKLLNLVPFESKGGARKKPTEDEDKKKNEGFRSKKSFFNKARIVNFLLEKNEKSSERSKFTQLNKKFDMKGDARPKVMRERFVDSKVPLEEDLEIKQYFKDLLFYVIYLIFLTTIAMSMISSNMYYFTNVTAMLFMDSPNIPSLNTSTGPLPELPKKKSTYSREKTLRKAHTFDDFWDVNTKSTMINLFFGKFFQMNSDDFSDKSDKKLLYGNQILGVPRLRQVRVRNDSCSIHPHVKRFFDNCYNYYSPFTEETRPIKLDMETSLTATAWIHTKAKKLKTSYYWGEISVYGGGGYYLDLDINKEKTLEMIKELKENLWLSTATRAIFIDFNIYNANVNLFCLCKIVLEFPPVGGIIPKTDFHTLKLIRYLTNFDFFILGCEFLLILFACYFTWKLLEKGRRQKTAFFFSFWNYLDLTIVLLHYVFILLNVIRYTSMKILIQTLNHRYYKYTEFDFVKEIQIQLNNVVAVLLFASWIKLVMYLTFNKILVDFKKTLQRSLLDIIGFLPIFLTIYFAFALLANLLFGNQVKDYSTVWSSFLSLLQAFLGEFEYSQIQQSSPILGPIFCVAFIFFMFFILLNVFIAIMNNAYSRVKSEVTLIKPKVGEYTKAGIVNMMTCCRPHKHLKKKASLKKRLIFIEIRKALENCGFTSDEIRIFFSKYNINVSNILHNNIRRKILEELELKRISFEDNANETQLNCLRRRMENLSSRLYDMEMNIQPVIDKVDILLNRSFPKKYS